MGEAEDKIYDQAWEAADLGDLGLALRIIDSLLEKYARSAAYWVTKAAFLEKSGDLEGAEDAARRAVKPDTRNEHAWTKLGYLLGRCGRFQRRGIAFGIRWRYTRVSMCTRWRRRPSLNWDVCGGRRSTPAAPWN